MASQGGSRTSRSRAYDPEQDRAVKVKLRGDLRKLDRDVQEMQGDVANVSPMEMEAMLKRSNEIFEKVKTPAEAVLDSAFLRRMAELTTARSKNMKVDVSAFDPDAFIELVKDCLGFSGGDDGDDNDDNDGWEKMGRIAAKHSRRVPTMEHLYGPLEVKPKTRIMAKRSKFVRSALDNGATVLRKEDIERSENETTKLVQDISKRLTAIDAPVNYFKFVVNPDSFSDTIENMFYVSFLVRDGKVMIEDDESGDPMLSACQEATDEDRQQGLTKRQLVFDMSIDLWNDLKDVYEITEPLIPTRPKIDRSALSKGKWY